MQATICSFSSTKRYGRVNGLLEGDFLYQPDSYISMGRYGVEFRNCLFRT